ncbi:DUF1642 domain-containing protein [Listeria monocytogenes]|nr:DUF1642 domain-containing protein [Listeria monocytogenes]EAC7560367.1 DUF1642 domain-containing protein [Listeria monocytogenes]EAC8715550.1 DUF1642 domain-containing protein [Listeria monocytogenes]EAD8334146.1 DUF1642 domain-containing protein [Listeria monocytogenes]EAD8859511.1 DUF1642 domain-containing protein [Listeria monocytogenes]
MRFKEGDKVQFIENNELIIGTIKRVNNDVGWVDLKVSDLSWFFRKLEDVVKVKEPELIAVPRFAADWINRCKQREYDLACLLDYVNTDMHGEMNRWLILSTDNQETLARAWLDGYEVEKEPLYYVKIIDCTTGYLNARNDGRRSLNDNVQNHIVKTQFTEGEIREIDERYWQFAVLVEEAEDDA